MATRRRGGRGSRDHDVETRQPRQDEDGEVSTSTEKMEVTRPFLPMDGDGKDGA
jgi:hypothetical protein